MAEKKQNNEAQFEFWGIKIRLSTKQYSILFALILFLFFNLFINNFPNYQRAILGNQSLNYTFATVVIYSPFAIYVPMFIVLFIILLRSE